MNNANWVRFRWCDLACLAWTSPNNHQPARGLVNLGNTCYLNSVVQALRFTPAFGEQLLNMQESESSQPVLSSIKQLISCLTIPSACLTVSPFDFLTTSRPPWFAEGEQQDCSEFLRYLLDTLHEQEKSSYNLAVKTSRYGFLLPSLHNYPIFDEYQIQ